MIQYAQFFLGLATGVAVIIAHDARRTALALTILSAGVAVSVLVRATLP